MRKYSGIKSVLYLYVIFALLLVGAVLAAAMYTTYLITVDRPDGKVARSDWPQQYAESFRKYISAEDGIPQINAEGFFSLERNELWIQILDEQGNQVAEHHKPPEIPDRYPIAELLDLAASGRLHDYTVTVFSFMDNEQSFVYIIGFPIAITKTTMYFNSDRYTAGRTVIFAALAGLCVLVLIAGLIYGIWLTKHLSRIVKSSGEIAARTYSPKRGGGVFGGAYKSLNELDAEIRRSDEAQAETERRQEEWITNITHDLKTPLSPIRGYAELLLDPDYSLSGERRSQYGHAILRNTEYAEKLVNDLKLTYQLKNNIFPLNMKQAGLTRFLKELIIEILNRPENSGRDIVFSTADRDVMLCFDETLLKRAINNLIDNALIHNTADTQIHVNLWTDDRLIIAIDDNGKGLSAGEMDRLFERYYRGTNTEARPEGTGLGMAIAKQIIEVHGGTITVNSEPGKGTHIEIGFPLTN